MNETTQLFTLGPEGTFSDKAARMLREHLGLPQPAIIYTRRIPETLHRAAEAPGSLAVIPIENSDIGTILPAQDALVRQPGTIEWEINVPVRFSLLGSGPLHQVEALFSHPASHEQCSNFLSEQMPNAQVSFTNSNTESGLRFEQAIKRENAGTATAAIAATAAIVPWDYADLADPALTRIDNIQNISSNTTRFLAVRAAAEETRHDFTRHKTALMIEPDKDYPGLLHEILKLFDAHQLNLCRLESRPARVTPWTYVFFLDFTNGAGSAQCLEELRATPNTIRVLGSFDTIA